MNEKTLFMHAGGSKTGSSAIQDFLELNTTKLENLGYAYQNRANIEHNHISSANGEILFKTLFSLISTDNEVDRLLLSFFGEQNNAICSSELFQHLTDQGWKNLFFSLDRLNIKVKIIFFIRNVISFLNSAYDQMIKGHGEVRPLDQFYLEEEWYHITALRNMITIFPKGNIKVLHYDSLKTNLIESFLDVVLDVNLLEFSHEELHKKVNRSLTTEERDILLKVNSAIGDIYSFELSSLLIYSNPNPNPDCQPIVVKKDIYELVRERYEDDINWVNDIFFKG